MRIPVGLTVIALTGCASTGQDLSREPPCATFSSTRPASAVTTCVRDRINAMEWGSCPKATAYVLQQNDVSELSVEENRRVDAILEGQQQGAKSVYELRVRKRASAGFCSLGSLMSAVAQTCM